MYVIGGYGPDGQPTTTVFSLTVENDGTVGEWATVDAIALPEPRAGAAAVTVSDGLVLLGGTDGTAATRSVWKSMADKAGALQAWEPQSPLVEENVSGVAAHIGDVIFLVGGRNKDGNVVATVQQGLVGGENATPEDPNAITALWRASELTNLPFPRANMSGFTANGVLYVQGGTDGTSPRSETLWAIPDADGVIAGWQSLAPIDLGEGLEGSSAVVSGSHAFLFGGTTAAGPTAGVARTNLAPQEPFFRLGVLGATLPGAPAAGRGRPADRLPQRRGCGHRQLHHPDPDRVPVQPPGEGPGLHGQAQAPREGLIRGIAAAHRPPAPPAAVVCPGGPDREPQVIAASAVRPVVCPGSISPGGGASARELALAGLHGAAPDRQAHALPAVDAAGDVAHVLPALLEEVAGDARGAAARLAHHQQRAGPSGCPGAARPAGTWG